jgi:hypothetical protein
LTVNAGSANNLVFIQQPTNTNGGSAISPAITVQVRDEYNNARTGDNSTQVSMAILTNPGSGALSGTTTRTASGGIATFNNLSINNAAAGYTLRATSSGLTAVTSNSFNITVTATWNGNVSNDWHTAGNWSNGQVPGEYTNVVIAQTARQPMLSSSTSITGLTINSGATLNMSGQPNLTLTGNLVNNGNFYAGEGTVIFNGTSAISGSYMVNFRNVTINSGATLTGRSGEMKVTGSWTNNGTYNHNNGTIVLEGGSSQSIKTGGAASAFNVIIIKNSVYSNCGGGGYNWYNPTLSDGVSFTDALYAAALILPYNQQDQNYGSYYMAPDGMKKISFAAGATHTITQTLMLSGSSSKLATLASTVPGTTWYLNPPTGTTLSYVFVSDSTVTGGKTVTASNSQNAGNNSGWNFGTVSFSGTGNFNDPNYWSNGYVPGQYDTVNLSSGSMSLSSAYTVSQMTVASGATFNLGGYALSASGGITNNGNLTLTGNETITGTLTNAVGSTVTYTGTGSGATILSNCTYKDLVINGNDTFTAGGNLNVEGTLSITTGTFDMRGRTIVASGGITNTGNMMLKGDETITGTITNAAGSTMTYTGSGAGTTTIRSDISYRDLVFNGSDTFKPNGDLNVSGAVTISNGTFDVNGRALTTSGSLVVSGGQFYGVGGDVVVNGDMQITNGTFTAPGSGKTFRVTGNWTNSGTFTHNNTPVEFSGTGTQTIDDNSGAFYGITHTGAGTLKLDDSVTINGDFSNTSGTFDLNGKTVTVKGSFTNSGAFNGTGTVTFDDATQVSYIHGTTFENLTVNTPGKELVFDAGATETITGTLTLTGAAGSLITLRSSVTGSQWNIDPQGTVNVSYVDVKDSKNLNSRIISPANSVNSGNNTNWFPAASTISTGAGDNVIYREQPMLRLINLTRYISIMPTAISIPLITVIPLQSQSPFEKEKEDKN